MLLDKECKRVLKIFEESPDSEKLDKEIIENKYHMDYDDFFEIVKYLSLSDYIILKDYHHNPNNYEVTYKGQHYTKFKFVEMRNALLDVLLGKVFLPVVVSAITTIITLLITMSIAH